MARQKGAGVLSRPSLPTAIIFRTQVTIVTLSGLVSFKAHEIYRDSALIALAIEHKLNFDTLEE